MVAQTDKTKCLRVKKSDESDENLYGKTWTG
jgi:hypothetical protein